MENLSRDKQFWREQMYEYMIRNKLTIAGVAEKLDRPQSFVRSVLYNQYKQIGYKTMGILMKIYKENEEAKANEQK